MKKLALLAAAGLTLVSIGAYAQMHQQQRPDAQPPSHQMGPGMMHQRHQSMMPGGSPPRHSTHGGRQHGPAAPGHAAATGPKGDTGPPSLAFHGIKAKMHAGMDIAFTGNADVDFVKGMIPQHEGAVDMAKTVLAFGKDPEIRKLAEEIVQAQECEIAMMKAWIAKNVR